MDAASPDRTRSQRLLCSNLNLDFFPGGTTELFKITEQGREQIRIVFNLPGGNDWLGRKSKKHREQSFNHCNSL